MLKQLVITFALVSFLGVSTLAQDKTETEKVTKEVTKKEKQDCMQDTHSCCGKHEMHSDMKIDPDKVGTETASAVAWNKVCPVKGEEVDSDSPTVEYNGKVYGFCCPGCETKFLKDPEKYMKNLNEDGTEFISN